MFYNNVKCCIGCITPLIMEGMWRRIFTSSRDNNLSWWGSLSYSPLSVCVCWCVGMCVCVCVCVSNLRPTSNWILWGPILHPVQLTFYTEACILASLHPAQSQFPPQQTCAPRLAPWPACRWKAEACSCANDRPTWCYLTDRLSSCATDRQIFGLSALADSTVGLAILKSHGRSELQHKLTHQ